jgi:thiamine kinase-like enzyme
MPSLATHSDSIPEFEQALRRLQEEGGRYFEPARIDFQPVTSRNRRFPRVLQVHVQNSAQPCDVFIKTFKPANGSAESRRVAQERLRREYEALLRFNAAMSGNPGLRVIRPIACFPEELCIVTERVPGITLRRFLKDSAPWRFTKTARNIALVSVFEKVGSWLRVFQKIDRSEKTVSLSAKRSYLESRLQLLLQHYPGAFSSADRDTLLRHFDRLIYETGSAEFPEVGVHADFTPDNVLVVNDSEIAVLDFEMASAGTRYDDLAHMYMHMDSQKAKPWIEAENIQDFQHALLRGFDPTLEAAHPMFQVALLIHVVCHFVFTAVTEKKASRIHMMRDDFLWRHRWQWLKSLGEGGRMKFQLDRKTERQFAPFDDEKDETYMPALQILVRNLDRDPWHALPEIPREAPPARD